MQQVQKPKSELIARTRVGGGKMGVHTLKRDQIVKSIEEDNAIAQTFLRCVRDEIGHQPRNANIGIGGDMDDCVIWYYEKGYCYRLMKDGTVYVSCSNQENDCSAVQEEIGAKMAQALAYQACRAIKSAVDGNALLEGWRWGGKPLTNGFMLKLTPR